MISVTLGQQASSVKSALATVSALEHSATAKGKHTGSGMKTGTNTAAAASGSSSAASSSTSGGLAPVTAVPILGAAIGGGLLAVIGLL